MGGDVTDTTRRDLLHTLRCAGTADTERLRTCLPDAADLATTLASLTEAGLVIHREGPMGGWMLTAEGRAEGQRLTTQQVDEAGVRDRLQDAYRRFLELNPRMLEACSEWQVRTENGEQQLNDHSDPEYDARVIGRLKDIDADLRPILDSLGHALSRFQSYGPRFDQALERIDAGQHEYFTSVRVPSHHTLWFELHEDLLASLGISREEERGHA